MSDKSNKYGYVGVDIPAQSFGANKGVFNPAEINDLVANNQWTSFGQLELIETQTVTSAVAGVDFTNLGDYKVHFLTINNFSSATDYGNASLRVSTDGGSSFKTSLYQYANQDCNTSSFAESKSTNFSSLTNITSANAGASPYSANAYCYLYNLLDSSRYSYATWNSSSYISVAGNFQCYFGAGLYVGAETHNAIRILPQNFSNVDNGTISLYGLRYS